MVARRGGPKNHKEADAMRTVSRAVVLAAAFLLMLALPALAATEDNLPWGDLEVSIGPVVLVWGAVVAGVVQVLKAVKVGSPPRPLLDTAQKIWLANLLLGGLGVLVYELANGTVALQAVLNAVMAVLTASGVFEAAKTAGKTASAQTGTG